ncbi:putative lipopolysaccharide heptosyltransferase III [Leeia sp.]|uniref:putative lipopolysaccharide heptosyltransferase III n=1 Tax=Leeia sp. TaxID=2884678 RepID=UPI0035B4DDB9
MPELHTVATPFRVAPADAVDFSTLRRVLLVKLRHHGDVLLASPVPQVLKNHFPQLEIDALVYADTAPMLQDHPALSQLHLIERQGKRQGLLRWLRQEWQLWRTLRGRQYDLLIHLTDGRRGTWLARWLGVRYSVAQRTGKRGWKKAFTHLFTTARKGNSRHTVEYHLDALRRLGLYPDEQERKLVLQPGTAATARVGEVLHGLGLSPKGFLHIHPPSRWLFKCWSVEQMAALIDRLTGEGWPVVLTGAPNDAERALNAAIQQRLSRPVHDLTGQLSLRELAALTAEARLFIGVDSAPMHMAAAMATPTVALFGPSGDIEWAPWQVPARVLVSSHACRPCGHDGCGGGKRSECLTTLSVEQVHQAVQSLLAETA